MKIEPRGIAAFLRHPGAARVVLLHGGDEGMVRHRARALIEAVIGSADDPFRLAWLSREDHGALVAEAAAISMMPGRRVVCVRDAVDRLAPEVEQVLAAPGDSLVILEAGELPGRSKLRTLLERHAGAGVIACYPEDGAALRTVIDQELNAAGVTADRDAKALLLERLGADRAVTRAELQKLILYAGAIGRLTVEDVEACVGDQSATSLDDAIFSCMSGDLIGMDRSLEKALAEGAAPVAVCRGLQSHLARMMAARVAMASGLSAEGAMTGLRPPIFFKRTAAFLSGLQAWPIDRIRSASGRVQDAEAACKQTGARDALVVRRLMLGLGRQAAFVRSPPGEGRA